MFFVLIHNYSLIELSKCKICLSVSVLVECEWRIGEFFFYYFDANRKCVYFIFGKLQYILFMH